jgi:hypothetical protein
MSAMCIPCAQPPTQQPRRVRQIQAQRSGGRSGRAHTLSSACAEPSSVGAHSSALIRHALHVPCVNAFVCHANWRYKAAYVEAFCQRIFRCAGPLGVAPCPHTFEDIASDASEKLLCLHLDHERPVHLLTCAQWSGQLAEERSEPVAKQR